MNVLLGIRLNEGIAAGFADVTFIAPTGEAHPIRLSMVAQRVEGTSGVPAPAREYRVVLPICELR